MFTCASCNKEFPIEQRKFTYGIPWLEQALVPVCPECCPEELK